MSYDSSTMYTMGTALGHALQDNAEVSVLADGLWLSGNVVLHDGVGVVLDNGEEHSIVKVDRIAAIKIRSRLPWRGEVHSEAAMDAPWAETPVPGPRSSDSY